MRALVQQAMDSGVQPEIVDDTAQIPSTARGEQALIVERPLVIPPTPNAIPPTPIQAPTTAAPTTQVNNTTSPEQDLEPMQGLPNDAPVLLVIGKEQ